MLLDFRAALRSLRRTPGFVIGAVLTLGLALGCVTTAFGLLAGALGSNGRADDLFVLYLTETVDGRAQRMRWPYAAVRQFRGAATSFESIATYTTATVNLTAADQASRIDIELVSPAYFAAVGVRPSLGRPPAASSDEQPGVPAEIVIGHDLWQRQFNGSTAVLGQTVKLSREPHIIVGVAPEGMRGLSGRAAAFVPHTMAPRITYAGYFTSEDYFHNVIATLKRGVDRGRAQAELNVVAGQMASVVPPRSEDATNRGAALMTLSEARTNASAVRARTYVAAGAVFVLLIAGVNLASLVSARVASRQREFGVRLAVGAGRMQVARTVGVEMAFVAAGGFALAVLLSAWTQDLVAWMIPGGIAAPTNDYGQLASFAGLNIDSSVVILAGVLGLLTMAGASIVAAWPAMRSDVLKSLRSGGDRSTTRGPGFAERALLVVQVAASLCLVASAGLVLKSVNLLDRVDPGFNPERMIAFSVAEDLAVQRPGVGPALVDRLMAALETVPGVESVTAGQCTPFGSRCARLGFSIEGRPETLAEPLVTGWHRVGPDHFAALGIPVIRGRGFTAGDRRGRAPVVVLNQAAAARFFPNQDPIGRRITLPEVIEGDPTVAAVVGVVGDVIYWPPDEAPGPDIYQPALQFSHPYTTVMIRVAPERWQSSSTLTGDSDQPMFDSLRRALTELDADLPMFDAVALTDLARAGRADRRFVSRLLTLCALLALGLAAVGIYSITASAFQSRRKDMGLRIALGARPAQLVAASMTTALTQAGLGVMAGVVLALVAGRALRAILFGVGPNDPAALAISAALMLLVAIVAAWLPARRALRIDPVEQLRAD